MPELKVFGRPLTDLEQFMVDTPGIVDQVGFLERLTLLVARHEKLAIEATLERWVPKTEPAKLPESFVEPELSRSTLTDSLIPIAQVLDGPSVSENVARLAGSTSVEPERTPCSSCGRVEGHTPGCRIVPSLTPKPEARPKPTPTPNMGRKETTKPAKRRKKGR